MLFYAVFSITSLLLLFGSIVEGAEAERPICEYEDILGSVNVTALDYPETGPWYQILTTYPGRNIGGEEFPSV
jgi:hypothetical protein